MDGFSSPYSLDRNRNGGGVMIFVKEDLPSKLLTKHNFPSDVEGLFVELNFIKSKWLLSGTYHPPTQNDQHFFNCIDKALDPYSSYDNVLLVADFNAEDDEPWLSIFLYQHNLYKFGKVGTCFKSSSKPIFIDLSLTTKNTDFQNTIAVCSDLPDFHKLGLAVLKALNVKFYTGAKKNSTLNLLMKIYKMFYLQHK